jgi:hypothetical protein
MKKFVAAVITAAIIAGFYAGASAQSVADKAVAPSGVAAPATTATVPQQYEHEHDGAALQCQALAVSFAQMQADMSAMRAEIAVMHQMLADMQKPTPHSVADVPGR